MITLWPFRNIYSNLATAQYWQPGM